MSKRFKVSVKFHYKDLELLETVLLRYIETAEVGGYELRQVEALVNHLYTDDEKNIKRHIDYLTRKGYVVSPHPKPEEENG